MTNRMKPIIFTEVQTVALTQILTACSISKADRVAFIKGILDVSSYGDAYQEYKWTEETGNLRFTVTPRLSGEVELTVARTSFKSEVSAEEAFLLNSYVRSI